MNIVLLSDLFPPYGFGAERVAHLFARHYVRAGHRVVIITTVQEKERAGVAEQEGMKIYRLYARYHERWRAYLGLYNPQTVSRVKSILRSEKPDVIHAHNVHKYLSYHSFKIARQLHIPVVATLYDAMSFDYAKFTQFINPDDHAQYPVVRYTIDPWITLRSYRLRYFPLRNTIIRWYLRTFVNTRAAASSELQQALSANGIHCQKVMYSGIELSDFQADPSAVAGFRQACNLPDKKVVLFAGRISYFKGGDHIVKAFEQVCRQVPGATLLVVGNKNSYTDRLQQLASSRGFGNNLVCTGWLAHEDLKAAYGACDLVVCPSICWDSFPTVNLEAMAMKKPVIATCFGGSKELVQDGVTGYIINPFNTDMLAGRIIELLSCEEKSRQMGAAGYQRVKDRFTLEQQAGAMLELLAALKQSSAAAQQKDLS